MGLHLLLEARQRQMQAMECSVCKQLLDAVSPLEAEILAKAGVIGGWAICPCCAQEVEPPFDLGYKIRFVRWCLDHNIKPK